ncbi:hypothetical protein D9615_008462 [Tricholomella constricta]|uniref:Uncharacterized protein n=1 Tax=Tricholomella constricta TaxID=117010 RepID=A0A8H5H427_9AGAR|nr:hypothetical protein D9615_008462 [Tricholomella constricta]
MSPDDRALLQTIGRSILLDFAAVIPVVLLHGVFITLFPFSTYILLRRGLASRPTQAMLGTTLMAFLLSSLFCISTVSNSVINIREAVLNFSGILEGTSVERLNIRVPMTSSISNVTMRLMPILNDSVVIWRAWVLYPDKQWIMLVPCAFLFGTTGATIAHFVLDVRFYQFSMLNTTPGNLFKAFLTLSLGTNVTATSLIFYKLWGHLRFLRSMGIKQNFTSPAQKILIVLVESGLAYCALQLSIIVIQFVQLPTLPFSFTSSVFINFLMLMSAMYPSIVILLVNLQGSTTESFISISSTEVGKQSVQDIESASAHPASLGHLSDAVNPCKPGPGSGDPTGAANGAHD